MRLSISIAACAAAAIAAIPSAHAQRSPLQQSVLTDKKVLGSAEPTECFTGVGDPIIPIGPNGCLVGQPKTNEAYVWGLTKATYAGAPRYWFGTGPNVHCLVAGGFLGATGSTLTDAWVCEGAESVLTTALGLPDALGDWRPARAYYQDDASGLVEVTAKIRADAGAAALLDRTIGLRSAGSIDDLIFLAGPIFADETGPTEGVAFFAFNNKTGDFIGSYKSLDYANIRRFLTVGENLYVGVGKTAAGGGEVLKWTGSLEDPFNFAVVGEMATEVANIATYKDRLAITTWPQFAGGASTTGLASVYVSPPLDENGLDESDAAGWKNVWSVDEYEPNPTVAAILGGGDLHEHDGKLVWGTMVVPGLPLVATLAVDAATGGDVDTTEELITAFLGSFRATTIFNGWALETDRPKVQVVYGHRYLPVYDYAADVWSLAPNASNYVPVHGPSGFGNFFNNYTWAMQEVDGRLNVGTMDSRFLFDEALRSAGLPIPSGLAPSAPASLGMTLSDLEAYEAPVQMAGSPHFSPSFIEQILRPNPDGADIWRFDRQKAPAYPENLSGVIDNKFAYGIRNMTVDGDKLIVGTANPMNLAQPQAGAPDVKGGWQLIELGPDRSGACAKADARC